MGKRSDIEQLTNILSVALRHKIGSIVNKDEFYSVKYAKDADLLIHEALKLSARQNWNKENKKIIRSKLRKKLFLELQKKDFLDNAKFDIMDNEIDTALQRLDLV